MISPKAMLTGSVQAPAGCGKTREIVELIRAGTAKPPLVLTHTNAGVAALRSRLRKTGISDAAYRLSTIDAWCQRIVRAFPMRAEHTIDETAEPDYGMINGAALKVLASGALDKPLRATYDRVLVDEYQDCDSNQHNLVTGLTGHLPVRVFGDPMQGIFGFAGATVEWKDVENIFPPLPPLFEPWRWKQFGCEALGIWLGMARDRLAEGRPIDLEGAPSGYVRWITKAGPDIAREALRAIRPRQNEHLLIIANAASHAVRHEFARRHPGVCVVERADLPDLMRFSTGLAEAASDSRLDVALKFAESVMTKTDIPQLKDRLTSLGSKRAKKPAERHEQACLDFLEAQTPLLLHALLGALVARPKARAFRPELFRAMLETLALTRTFEELPRRALAVRAGRRFAARRLPRWAIGSTLLLKGLEADHSFVLDADGLTNRHLYVALTRGSRSLTIISKDRVVGGNSK